MDTWVFKLLIYIACIRAVIFNKDKEDFQRGNIAKCDKDGKLWSVVIAQT